MEPIRKGKVLPIDAEKLEPKSGELSLPGNVKITLPSPADGQDELRVVFSHQIHYTDENKLAITRASLLVAMAAMAFCAAVVTVFVIAQ